MVSHLTQLTEVVKCAFKGNSKSSGRNGFLPLVPEVLPSVGKLLFSQKQTDNYSNVHIQTSSKDCPLILKATEGSDYII